MQGYIFGLILAFLTTPALVHAETCWTMGGTQFANASHFCVSTVLPAQSGNGYGPEMLYDGNPGTAWCEGAADEGHGQWIELRWSEPQYFQTLYIDNGYDKSDKVFRDNGAPVLFRVETGDGLVADIPVYDQPGEQPIHLPRAVETDHIRLTIITVRQGLRFDDTCVSEIWADLEELNYY